MVRGGFARGFQAPVLVDAPGLLEEVRRVLEREVLNQLGRLRVAGRLVAGRTEVIDAVKAGTASLLLFARDLAERTLGEVRQSLGEGAAAFATVPAKDAVGHAIGRKATGVLALVGDGPAALRFRSLVERYDRLDGLEFIESVKSEESEGVEPGVRADGKGAPEHVAPTAKGSEGAPCESGEQSVEARVRADRADPRAPKRR